MSFEIIHGDCVEAMRCMPDASVDSIVTDPPYELGFMGKAWDATGIAYNVEMWLEALRVLKPGGHLLAFSGSRTYHRMVCAIEDAGFEIRDQIMWVYGSGFPKSHNVSLAINGDKCVKCGHEWAKHLNLVACSELIGKHEDGQTFQGATARCLCEEMPSREWDGWGTALKPAHEPIVVARKPLIGTVAANVLAHGTGALNIDGCRVGTEGGTSRGENGSNAGKARNTLHGGNFGIEKLDAGRWPANLIHDGSEEVLVAFPQAPGQQGDLRQQDHAVPQGNAFGQYGPKRAHAARVESDKSAARFFYCAKASRADRGAGNTHPTVKPAELMRYLCRLVTPLGGLVLDPFAGSGSTGKAALLEGFRFTGIEREADYVEIARARISAALPSPDDRTSGAQISMDFAA